MAKKKKSRRGGSRPGSGRKVDPENPGMPRENTVLLLLPDDLSDCVCTQAVAWGMSRPEAVREIIRRWRAHN